MEGKVIGLFLIGAAFGFLIGVGIGVALTRYDRRPRTEPVVIDFSRTRLGLTDPDPAKRKR